MGVRNTYLKTLEQQGIPAFVSACSLRGGMFLLIQPVANRTGMFFELYWKDGAREYSSLINEADVEIGDQVELGEFLHGGLQTERITNSIVHQLIKLPFRIYLPSEFDRIVKINPRTKCDTRDPGSSNLTR